MRLKLRFCRDLLATAKFLVTHFRSFFAFYLRDLCMLVKDVPRLPVTGIRLDRIILMKLGMNDVRAATTELQNIL